MTTIAAPTAALPPAPPPVDPAIKSAAQEFEAVFLSQMMTHMFAGVETDPVFGGGPGEDMFRGMMILEYGKHMARLGTGGLSAQIQKTLIDMQQHGR
ncbi:MAG TPA: hypothetical protein DHV85_12625 [Candidatus Accumulibacter sp.]|nr:hypothetical protein [Accumulibacter sp.]